MRGGNKISNLRDVIYANLVILATAVTYYQLIGGESWTLRWLRSLFDKMDITDCHCFTITSKSL